MKLRRRSKGWAVVAAGVLSAVVGVGAEARAERRALVIANARYRVSGANLANPGKDARRVVRALEAVGFAKGNVTLVENLTKKGFTDEVGAFAGRLQPGDEAFVYYSGHGIAIEGTNYLLGVDFDADNAADAKWGDVYAVAQLIERLELGAARLRVVVVDACRDQPFTKSWSRSRATKGFVAIPKGSTGTLVAFAAGDGEQAADNADGIEGGPYAHALARLLTRPGLEVHHLFRDVATEVRRLTRGRQRPDFTTQLDGDFYFVASAERTGVLARSEREASTEYDALDRERREAEARAAEEAERRARMARETAEKLETAWAKVEKAAKTMALTRDKRVKALERFLLDFPEDNPHRELAETYLARLRAGEEPSAPEGMVAVPAGPFFMGCNDKVDRECEDDEKPGKTVDVKGFFIDRTEVTVAEYAACVKAGACSAQGLNLPYWDGQERPEAAAWCNWGQADKSHHPINCVDWAQARAFCSWRGKRLPTEAEWEKAARGTDRRKYPWGNSGYVGAKVANIADESFKKQFPQYSSASGYDDGHVGTAPAGSFADGRSPYGALDMVGNVWEWTADWYTPNENRAIRGGSWDLAPRSARASPRLRSAPSSRFDDVGFRCLQSFTF